MDPNRNTCVHKEAHTITCCKQCSLHPPTHSWVPFHWCQQLQLSFSLSLTHTPVEHLSDCTAHSRTPSSHELIGKAIKGSVGPARWRNVLFCYLASKLTKPVRSHLADAGWAIFIYFLLEKLDAGSLHCLPSNNEVILRGRLAGWDMNPPPTVYLGGWLESTSHLACLLLWCWGSLPCSWEAVPSATPNQGFGLHCGTWFWTCTDLTTPCWLNFMVAVTEQKQILYSEKSMYKLCGLIKKNKLWRCKNAWLKV